MATPSKPYPSIPRAILLILTALVLQFFLSFVGGFLLCRMGLEFQSWHLGLINCLALGLVYAWGCLESDESIGDLLPFQGVTVGGLIALSVTVIGINVLICELLNFLSWALPLRGFWRDMLEMPLGDEENIYGVLFFLVVVAPITEEPLFRGLILNGFLNRFKVRWAIVASSILFALMHLNPIQFPVALILGMLFGWWRVHSRSLWPCLWGHALNNGLPTMLAMGGVEIAGYPPSGAGGPPRFQALWLDLSGAALVLLGLVWTAAIFRRQSAPPIARAVTIPLRPPLGTTSEVTGQ
ncbi:MAG TPA: type II CAAX endopeptidase family protein [Phycisphaerae bacterium]|nr:type II CAAX endopeptidase family protein [Phycisphaerae bacterium]